MSQVEQKIRSLRDRLMTSDLKGGALLVVYPPEEERDWQAAYAQLLQELGVHRVDTIILDFRTLVFELLSARGLLDRAFQLDAEGSRDAQRNLAGMVHREVVRRLRDAAAQNPRAVLCCQYTAALYPWISYSSVLEKIEGTVANAVVIPFPGSAQGPALHFLNQKDGYNYRAARI
jgi:hypothetical protein